MTSDAEIQSRVVARLAEAEFPHSCAVFLDDDDGATVLIVAALDVAPERAIDLTDELNKLLLPLAGSRVPMVGIAYGAAASARIKQQERVVYAAPPKVRNSDFAAKLGEIFCDLLLQPSIPSSAALRSFRANLDDLSKTFSATADAWKAVAAATREVFADRTSQFIASLVETSASISAVAGAQTAAEASASTPLSSSLFGPADSGPADPRPVIHARGAWPLRVQHVGSLAA